MAEAITRAAAGADSEDLAEEAPGAAGLGEAFEGRFEGTGNREQKDRLRRTSRDRKVGGL